MYKLLKKYSEENKEKFNKDFITSRNDQDVLQYFKDIFASLEILDEVKVEEVRLETDESQFGPIKTQHKYFKSILQSRLNRVYYRVKITPSENTENIPILDGTEPTIRHDLDNENSFIKEGYVYINKLIDKAFYINEGVRYYLIYQIVDNATYGTGECVSLKSLAMPITIERNKIVVQPEFMETSKEVPSFEVRLFAKKVNPLLYFIGKEAYNFLVKMNLKDPDNFIEEWYNAKDPDIVKKLNNFLGTDLEFSSHLSKLTGDDRIIFNLRGSKDKDEDICYFSVSKEKFENDYMTQGVVGSLLDMKSANKKKRITFTYDQLISPWFWVNELAAFFTKNSDSLKKLKKLKQC